MATTQPDWLLPWFPELRHGPPWVTEDMVATQPALAGLLDGLASPAAPVAAEIARAVQAGEPVVAAGCGTSEHAAAALVEQLDEALRTRGVRGGTIELRESFEATLDPRAGGVFIGISHGGRSRATVEALEAAKDQGAVTVLVTADRDAPAAHSVEHLLLVPSRDESFCHTVAYLATILVGAVLAATLDGTALESQEVRTRLDMLLERRGEADRVAARLHGVRHLLCVGSGTDLPAARELALKVEEAARLPATALDLESLLHGHLVAADQTTGLVLMLTDGRRLEPVLARSLAALAAARRIGVRTAAIVTASVTGRIDPALVSAGLIVTPATTSVPPLLDSLLSSAVCLQLLTLGLVEKAGVNPDLIRREEAAYREAAALGEAKIR